MTAGLLAAAAVLAQICYPLVQAKQQWSVLVVVVSCAAVLRAAGGRNATVLLAVAGAGSLVAETVGLHTGVPFGRYSYTGHLGPRLAGVPVAVPLAWTSMAWPCLCVARRLGRATVPAAAVAMAAWDVYLDPQLVRAGGWTWRGGGPALQGIPWTNFAGWLGCSLVLMAVLDRLLARSDDLVPVALWVWTWVGSLVADELFLGLHVVGVLGLVAMGVVGVPALLRPRRHPRRRPAGRTRQVTSRQAADGDPGVVAGRA